VDEAIEGLVVKPPSQRQRGFEPLGEKAAIHPPGGIAREDARAHQGVRIEGGDAERLAAGGAERDERARRQRLRRPIHRHFVGIDPGMSGRRSLVAARLKRDGGPPLGIVAHAGGECSRARGASKVRKAIGLRDKHSLSSCAGSTRASRSFFIANTTWMAGTSPAMTIKKTRSRNGTRAKE
jgi:hypothetical protein